MQVHRASRPAVRTKTGCLTCRMRRKKCTEQKPTCLGCTRNHLICSWPSSQGIPEHKALPCNKKIQPDEEAGPKPQKLVLPLAKQMSRLHEPNVARLLDHYVNSTAARISGRVTPQNPFLTCILPIAQANDTLLQAVIAVSGAHLQYSRPEIEYTSRSHYAVALRSVKHSLLAWKSMKLSELISLLGSILFLCMFELVSGSTDGALFYHLRACRKVLLYIKSHTLPYSLAHFLDFFTELYAFLAISANITLHTNTNSLDREITWDSSLNSLAQLNRDTEIYGVMFGSAHDLYALIPRILQSARESENSGVQQKAILVETYENMIRDWKPDQPRPVNTASVTKPLVSQSTNTSFQPLSETADLPMQSHIAGEIYQQAVLVLLYTAFHGKRKPTAELEEKVNECLDILFHKRSSLPTGASIETTLMWPMLIAGSCTRRPEYRQIIISKLAESRFSMWSLKKCYDLLLHVWEEQEFDDRVYGIYGLELVMLKRGMNICVG